jgi:site-specific DNA-cytosine methylase
VDNPFKSPAVISFCPGILGIERGLKRAGVHPRVMAYVEIEAFICTNLVAGMEAGILDPAPIWTDAKSFDARQFRGRIHGIIGGYPCTPFSLAGTRSGENHPGHIYPAISRAIEATRPIWCFFENVDDHLSLGFDKVYQDLQRMGYAVETGIYTAEEVGAPHERERMFILALASRELWHWSWNEGNGGDEYSNSGEELANTKRAEWGEILTNNQGNQQYDVQCEGTQNPIGFEKCSSQLVDSFGQRLEGFGLRTGGTEQKFTLSPGISDTQFPAPPGEQQHTWEEPRTIESGMGSTTHGYNFREDLLRALGNSVVEQTAELAFIDLLKKHLNGK